MSKIFGEAENIMQKTYKLMSSLKIKKAIFKLHLIYCF
jgi:hypothetical protein